MRLDERWSIGLTAFLSLSLTSFVLLDIYVDWRREGKPLWSTLGENAVPVALGIGVLLGGYWIYAGREDLGLETVTRWQYIGAGGLLLIAGEVVGLQLIQGELKPGLIVVQMAIGGAVAGTLLGYTNARKERTRAELQRERDRFETLFENAPAGAIVVTLEDGTPVVRRSNRVFREDVLDGQDVAGRPLSEMITHEDLDAITEAIAGSETYRTEIETQTPDGQRYFQLRVVPVGRSPEAYFLYTDVTELRRTKEELEGTVEQLERSNERLQQFAYVASHDLQEPLRMVSSYVSLLASEYEEQLDAEADEYIEFAVDGAERMQDMIDALLSYSRVHTKGEEFTETDAGAVVDDTLRDLQRLVEEHDATVTCDELPAVEADRNQLGQVFQNLIENAIEHGGHGTTVHVSARRRDGEVVFSVADDGPGIPDDQQERIFEIFEQGNREVGGTGMGLAICDRIVSRHGGEFWVDSTEGDGTTFHFSMPAVR